jgi:hypothetical protein
MVLALYKSTLYFILNGVKIVKINIRGVMFLKENRSHNSTNNELLMHLIKSKPVGLDIQRYWNWC